jgi:hypothetical protein
VSLVEPELDVNINADGSLAIVARPWMRFPPLAAPSYPIHFTVAAEGYLAYGVEVDVSTGHHPQDARRIRCASRHKGLALVARARWR